MFITREMNFFYQKSFEFLTFSCKKKYSRILIYVLNLWLF